MNVENPNPEGRDVNGSGIFHNNQELPQSRVDFLINSLKAIHGEEYLQQQIKDEDLHPETDWYELIAHQMSKLYRDEMIHYISNNIIYSLNEARARTEEIINRYNKLSVWDQMTMEVRFIIIATSEFGLEFGSGINEIRLQQAFHNYIDNISYWNDLLDK